MVLQIAILYPHAFLFLLLKSTFQTAQWLKALHVRRRLMLLI